MPWILLGLGAMMLMVATGKTGDRQLARNFWLREWAVSSGWPHLAVLPTSPTVIARIRVVATYLQVIRDELTRRTGTDIGITITSGWRSHLLNAAIPGSSDTSDHMTGWGVDFIAAGGWSNDDIIQVIWELVEDGRLPRPDQVITYDAKSHVHASWSDSRTAQSPRGEWKVKNAGPGYRPWRAAA